MAEYYPTDYFTHHRSDEVGTAPTVDPEYRDPIFTVFYGHPASMNHAQPGKLARLMLFPRWLRFRMRRQNSLVIPWHGSGKILDVGCGSGRFLEIMARRGWIVAGQEIDPRSATAAGRRLGIDVFNGELRDVPWPKDTFDVVHLSHVIEHLHRPLEVLKTAFALLRPGGRIYLRLPNGDGFGARHYRERWFGLDAPRHLTTFGPSTVTRALESSGFVMVRIRGDRGSSCLKNTYLHMARREGQTLMTRLARINPIMRALETFLWIAGRSDAIIATARKPVEPPSPGDRK